MANPEHLQPVQQGVEAWHAWCAPHKDVSPGRSGVDLSGANISYANLMAANVGFALLAGANFTGAGLADTPLTTANFSHANLSHAHCSFAALHVSDRTPTNLTHASLNDERREEPTNTQEDPHPHPLAPHLPVSAGLCPAQRPHQACGFHGLAQLHGGTLGSAVDQGGHGSGDGVLPRHVEHKDAPRSGEDGAEWEASIPLGRGPFRLEPNIPAAAGERILRGHTGSGLERVPLACPQGIYGGLG